MFLSHFVFLVKEGHDEGHGLTSLGEEFQKKWK